MGFFGGDEQKIKLEFAKELAHNANSANMEIGELLASFEENEERFVNLSDSIIDLSQRILGKLDETEMTELTDLTELTCRLHAEYLERYNQVLDLSKSQMERTKAAVEKYERIAQS